MTGLSRSPPTHPGSIGCKRPSPTPSINEVTDYGEGRDRSFFRIPPPHGSEQLMCIDPCGGRLGGGAQESVPFHEMQQTVSVGLQQQEPPIGRKDVVYQDLSQHDA
jgi:hypothetical protein